MDLKKKDIERMASLLCGAAFFSTRAIEEDGIRSLKFLDGGTGMNFEQLFGDLFAGQADSEGYSWQQFDNVIRHFFEEDELTDKEKELHSKIRGAMEERLGGIPLCPGCYPCGNLLGATWDKDTVRKVGQALGIEANAYGIDCLLGTPNLNILREPRNGRFFEGLSEDPCLTGEMAAAFIKGVQSKGVAANAKHYAANNLEINRGRIDELISKRALEEIYLPGFKACVKAGVKTVMAAYPKINGTYCIENRYLLSEVLKQRWGFEGVVMTDWGACRGDAGDAIGAGTDLLMPGPRPCDDIVTAAREGRLESSRLQDAYNRMKELVSYCSAEKPEISPEDYIRLGDEAAYRAACEGIVMLKNRAGAFPVEDPSRYVLFGSEDMRDYGNGSAQVFTSRKHSLTEYLPGCTVNDISAVGDESISVIVCSIESGEGTDREDLKIPERTMGLIKRVKALGKGKTALVLNTPGPVEIPQDTDIDAIFVIFYPGMEGKHALADIMTGKVSPCGKLPFTWPVRYEDTPAYLCYPDTDVCIYGEDIYVGYRGYCKRKTVPAYPFGYGLTYSKTKILSAAPGANCYFFGDTVTVKADIENTGCRDVREVIQVYVKAPGRDICELRAFSKVTVKAGTEESFELQFDTDDLVIYREDYGRLMRKNGIYEVFAGTSSEDIAVSFTIRIGGGDRELDLGPHSALLDIRKYPEVLSALEADIEEQGLDKRPLTDSLRYDPSVKVCDLYPNARPFIRFEGACEEAD